MTETTGENQSTQETSSLPRQIDSKDLFGEQRTVFIVHAGEKYRLMITRNDKLILQK